MDTRLLRIFTAVARHGSLPPASRELHLTASALSHGLKALEAQLGARLFDRVGKKLVLNHAGEQLLTQVEKPLVELEKAAESIRSLSQWGQGRIRLGAPQTICQHVLPRVLRELQRTFPRLSVLLESGDTPQLMDWLRQDRIDLALGVEPEAGAQFEVKPWFEDELLLAVASEHACAQCRSVDLLLLAKQPFVTYDRTSSTAQILNRFLEEQRIELLTRMEVRDVAAIRELVTLNVGAAFLAPWVFGRELASGRVVLRPVSSKPLWRRWSIIHLPQRRLTLAEEQLLKLCRRQAASLRRDRKDLPGPNSRAASAAVSQQE